MSTTNTSSGGIGFTGLLALLFIALKLLGVIDWSWWWVLSPIIIPIAFFIVLLAGLVVGTVIISLFSKRKRGNGR